MCVCVLSHLGIADLQGSGVQLLDPGVVSGHQHTVLTPQDLGRGVTCRLATQDHRAIYGDRLIGWALLDHRWGPV